MIGSIFKKNFPPQPHILDLRSLLLFRTLFGLYFCYDVVSRLLPFPLSVEWYTDYANDDNNNKNEDNFSLLQPTDSPHGNIIHKIWFARTSATMQYVLFGITFVLSLTLSLGKLRAPVARLALWILVVSMQHRCMHVHDGSDNFSRQLLMWYLLLPQQVHTASFSQIFRTKHSRSSGSDRLFEISSLACLGLTLQITLMYLGTVAMRILRGTSVSTEWKPPDLSAVYYVLRDAFAIRGNIVVNWMRSQPFSMTQGMTAHAMIAESSSLIWFLCSNGPFRYCGFWVLVTLHFGLLLVTRLPNWQFVAMIASILWIPSCVWNDNSDTLDNTGTPTGGEESTEKSDGKDASPAFPTASSRPSRLRQFVMVFLLTHMGYNFAAERQWIPKLDGGDIGEFFRISQYWVMYATAPTTSVTTHILGYNKKATDGDNGVELKWVDILQAIQTGESIEWNSGTPTFFEDPPIVSPRWERALNQWSRRRDRSRIQFLLRSLCGHFSEIKSLEYAIFQYTIVPPPDVESYVADAQRWKPHSSNPDQTIRWQCSR